MTDYRRNFIAGGSFFFTVNLANRRLRLLTEHIDELRAAFRETRRRHPFTIDAIVVLPDHSTPLDAARRRGRFRHALAADQDGIFTPRPNRRTDFRQPCRQSRARHLAAALLGTHHSRRERFRASHRLCSHQPGEA
jgi:hypothetical protein